MRTQTLLTAEFSGDPGLDSASLDDFLDRASGGGSQAVASATVQCVADLLGDRGICVLLDGGPHIACSTQGAVKSSSIDLERYPELNAAILQREVIVVEDVKADARLESVRAYLPADLVAVVVVPLVLNDRCLGAVLVQSLRRPVFDALALATARLIARVSALLLAGVPSEELVTAQARDLSIAPSSVSPDSLKNSRLLIIDDDDEVSASLADILSLEGYRVERAKDGTEGIRRALEFNPDLVLMDVNLPGMNGFEAAARLRRMALTGTVPLLFLSGGDQLPVQVRGAALEHADFILKPFSTDELLTRVHQAVVQSERDKHLQHAADRDELTALGNLRCLRRRLKLERSQFERYGHPLSLAMIDVDKFKSVNDQHGHIIGSEVLRGIAQVLTSQARDSDLVVRYGGDEFVALLPHTSLVHAESFATRVLTEVAQLEVQGARVTLSVGVACLTQPGGSESNEELLRRADLGAYEAKRCGGNCVRAIIP